MRLLPEDHLEYLRDPKPEWTSQTVENEFWTRFKLAEWTDEHPNPDYSFPLPVTFRFLPETDGTVVLESGDTVRRIPAHRGEAAAYNLIPGAGYRWHVETDGGCSGCASFTTEAVPPRLLWIPGMSNARDLGGYPAGNGRRTRFGRIFRTSEADGYFNVTDEGRRVLAELGIRTDLDLRRDREVRGPVLDPEQVRWVHIPWEPYCAVFGPEMTAQVRSAFEVLADESAYPILCHCVAGMDRTGVWALLLEGILGVAEETALVDYELSSFSIFASRSRKSFYFAEFYDKLMTYGADFSRACAAFLRSCGVTEETQEKIRALLTEPVED